MLASLHWLWDLMGFESWLYPSMGEWPQGWHCSLFTASFSSGKRELNEVTYVMCQLVPDTWWLLKAMAVSPGIIMVSV